MRYSTTAIALLMFNCPALAADIAADSLVTAATVYPSGATVTRKVAFEGGAGENRIIVDDLPLNFDAASLRVSGQGSAEFSIVSVDHRVTRLPPAPDEAHPDRDRIEAEIEALEEQLTALGRETRQRESDIRVAQTRLDFVQALMEREPQKMVDDVEYTRATAASWSETIDVLAQQTQVALSARDQALAAMDDIEDRRRDVSDELQKKQRELDATQQPAPPRSIATVEIASDSDVNGALEITYRVDAAGWEPVYDLRLDQGAEATLEIERHARITQNTGEDWNSVDLTLSTARPSQRMDAPELWASQVVQMPDAQPYASGASIRKSMAPPSPAMEMRQAQADLLSSVMEEAPAEFEADGVMAEIDTQGQTVVFRLTSKATVSGDGTVRQLGIDKGTSEVGLLARATPELDTNAYLYAALTNRFGGPILPGRASAFRDGTFVGEVWMPLIAAGKETTLPFGVLDGLEITRHVIEKQDGDYGIIGTTSRRVERYELTAESVLGYSIPVTLFDRAPFSEDEDLEVEPYARPEPSETDIDGKRGVRSWTFDLPAGGTKNIQFGFEITWPGEGQIIVQ